MSIVRSFLQTALNVQSDDLFQVVHDRMSSVEEFEGLSNLVEPLLNADHRVQDELWKFSTVLDVPHQLLCDSYWLQQKVSQQFKFNSVQGQ